MERWSLPTELAHKVLGQLELTPPEDVPGVAELIEKLGLHMPSGSTAKLRDMAAGRRPAGDDPAEVAETWLDDPKLAWSCWATATLTAALVHTGPLEAQVLGVRRIGADAPPVDVHSVLMISDGDRRWICDPHFGVGPVPVTGGIHVRPALQGLLVPRPDHRFRWSVGGAPFSVTKLRYRSLTGPLDQSDVAMFCQISVTYSGVQRKPFALLLLPDGQGTLRADDREARPELRLWRGHTVEHRSAAPEILHLESWEEGMDTLLAAGAGTLRVPG